MPIPILPDAPSRTDPTNFSVKADAWVAALGPWTTAANQLEQSLQLVATTGTSTTSKTIANGSWTLTTQTGKAWSIGAYLYFASSSDVSKVMTGQVTAYNSGTGSLTVNITVVRGSGTYANWVIGLAVPDQAALNLSGGAGGSIPYQSSANTTSMLAAGSAGQVLQCNGASAPSWVNNAGRLIATQIFTSSGTYTATAGTTFIIVEMVAGGGGGGSVNGTSASISSAAGGGGSGTYMKFKVSGISSSSITVGTGGAGASTGSVVGSNGGQSVFGAIALCQPGYGGRSNDSTTAAPLITFGGEAYPYTSTCTATLLALAGERGAPGLVFDNRSNGIGYCNQKAGDGGGNPLGHGGRGGYDATGGAGQGYGSGGGGSSTNANTSTLRAGGAGANGIVIVYEYA